MTRSILTVSALSLLVALPALAGPKGKKTTTTAPALTKSAVAPKPKPKATTTAKVNVAKPQATLTSDNLAGYKAMPKFGPLLSKSKLKQGAKAAKVVPAGGSVPLTTLATLSAGNSREGEYSIDFRCAFVHTYPMSGPNGFAIFPNSLIEHCRTRAAFEPGIEVSFPAEAGKAYAVDCNSGASTRFEIRHKVGTGPWSATATIETNNPTDFVLADQDGEGRVRMVFNPVDNHILEQSIRVCRVSQIG